MDNEEDNLLNILENENFLKDNSDIAIIKAEQYFNQNNFGKCFEITEK